MLLENFLREKLTQEQRIVKDDCLSQTGNQRCRPDIQIDTYFSIRRFHSVVPILSNRHLFPGAFVLLADTQTHLGHTVRCYRAKR